MKKELIKNMVSLIVGEALLEFIENPTSPNIVNDLREKYSEKILSAIDSMQEEPVSEDNTLRKASEEYLKVLSETPYNNTPITNAQTIVRELITFLDNPSKYNPNHIEELGEDLEQAIDTYLATYFGGEKEKQDWPFLKKMAIHFANWQKQQMMKDAVDTELDEVCGVLTVHIPYHNGVVGEKVKLILVKED